MRSKELKISIFVPLVWILSLTLVAAIRLGESRMVKCLRLWLMPRWVTRADPLVERLIVAAW